ncbi:hypothetical protein ACFYTQ_19865 [Nocardia sp. NPDC004068]|uniref:DUF7373 family lipoprotein n=1 Tax=Nocardia sp. NPDC004068 TaxID=3364303 RepID=UPI00367879ED
MSAGMVATVGLSACGSDSSGAGVSDPVVDLGQLDVGKYSTQPRDLGVPNSEGLARFMEAERLGNVLPLPYEIDPALKFGESNVHAFLDTDNSHLSPMFRWVSETGFADAAKNYIGGFSTLGTSDQSLKLSHDLVNTALLFKDENSAREAAAALSRGDFIHDDPVEPVPLSNHPNTVARWQPAKQIIVAWTPVDRIVLVTIVSHYENAEIGESDLPFLTNLAEKAIDVTEARLKNYRPTPPDQLMTVPVDRENMRGRALKRPDGDSYENVPGVYDQHGALNFVDDVEFTAKAYNENGVDLVAFDGASVTRARDAQAAQKIFDDMAKPDRMTQTVNSPKGLPIAKCFQYKGPKPFQRFTCFVRYGRYASSTGSQQLQDAQQRISAQYALLVNSK